MAAHQAQQQQQAEDAAALMSVIMTAARVTNQKLPMLPANARGKKAAVPDPGVLAQYEPIIGHTVSHTQQLDSSETCMAALYMSRHASVSIAQQVPHVFFFTRCLSLGASQIDPLTDGLRTGTAADAPMPGPVMGPSSHTVSRKSLLLKVPVISNNFSLHIPALVEDRWEAPHHIIAIDPLGTFIAGCCLWPVPTWGLLENWLTEKALL
jgi:hypothetical protein